jgi:glycosyltransferase involved in cell wall biosynthesis
MGSLSSATGGKVGVTRTEAARNRVLLISPVPSHPATAGNRRRVLNLLEMLESFPCDFRFLWFAQESGDIAAMRGRWGERLVPIPIQCPEPPPAGWWRVRNAVMRRVRGEHDHPLPLDAFRHEPLRAAIAREAAGFEPTCVITSYVFWSWVLELFPKTARKLIDTHDILGDRQKRFLEAGVRPEWIFTTRGEERRGLRRADCVLAIQEREAEYFRALSGRPVITVGHTSALRPVPEPSGAPALLFVGSDNGVNRDAAEWLLRECWPIIRRSRPDCRLRVAGTVCQSIVNPPDGVQLDGIVDDIESAYAGSQLALCPLRFGSGLKIKCIEALSFGRPLVTTTPGAVGIDEGAGTAFLLGDTSSEFADACLRLLNSTEERDRLRHGAIAFLSRWNERSRAVFESAVLQNV